MSFLSSLNISGSALTANRLWMDVISENIANAETTSTDTGEPYRRKTVTFSSADDSSSFSSILSESMNESSSTKGVVVTAIEEDQSEFTSVYDPTNAAADENGYVLMPNVDVTKETLDMMTAKQAYEANITVFNAVKSMASKALEMGS